MKHYDKKKKDPKGKSSGSSKKKGGCVGPKGIRSDYNPKN